MLPDMKIIAFDTMCFDLSLYVSKDNQCLNLLIFCYLNLFLPLEKSKFHIQN